MIATCSIKIQESKKSELYIVSQLNGAHQHWLPYYQLDELQLEQVRKVRRLPPPKFNKRPTILELWMRMVNGEPFYLRIVPATCEATSFCSWLSAVVLFRCH